MPIWPKSQDVSTAGGPGKLQQVDEEGEQEGSGDEEEGEEEGEESEDQEESDHEEQEEEDEAEDSDGDGEHSLEAGQEEKQDEAREAVLHIPIVAVALCGALLDTMARCTVAGGDQGRLQAPVDVAVSGGALYVAEHAGRIRRVDLDTGIITAAGGGKSVDWPCKATEAELCHPSCPAPAPGGGVYITDAHRVLLLRNGVVSVIAGNTFEGHRGDGGPAANARLSTPAGVAEADGELFVADYGNNRVRRMSFAPQ
eukprot:TRINITY_DN38100_c0_g1_i1.p1 TRINITY_DN38100_c0_g1~~TRINITY_DN38100_c0_g1_i1.p1  ORF type:complete len:255 (+),score=64.63 TRINITY_DN38100_c0_g1_i1:77-841(+)